MHACSIILQKKKGKREKIENVRQERCVKALKTQQMTQHIEGSNFSFEVVMQDFLSLEVGRTVGRNIVVHLS